MQNIMNNNASTNQERPRSHHRITDITLLARGADLPYAASVSAGLAEMYHLASTPLPGDRADIDDLVWEVSRALNHSEPTQPWPGNAGEAYLVEFPSFLDGEHDATMVRVVATLLRGPHGQTRLCISRPDQESPQPVPLILVAEDDGEIGRTICRTLGGYGFHALWVTTGAEALAWAAEYRPELILLDMDLPDIHALSVCSQLRRGPLTKSLPIVIASAWMGGQDEAAKAGATGYLEKPQDFSELGDRLRWILATSAEQNCGNGDNPDAP